MNARIAAASAGKGPLHKLLDEALAAVQRQQPELRPDLGLCFLTNHFEDEVEQAARRLRESTGVKTLLGCTAEAVIGPEHEHENQPALAVWFAELPGVELRPFAIDMADMGAANSPAAFQSLVQVQGDPPACYLVLGDPFTLDIDALLGGINRQVPGALVFGGMASGAEAPGQTGLIWNDEVRHEGAVGVALAGKVPVRTVVSQGCRSIGKPLIVTRAERNIIHTLGGRKALDVLNEIFHSLPTSEQALARQGLFLGRAINEQKETFQSGDFLIRNLMGADETTGVLAVNDLVRVGITVQFHVRDAATADAELRSLLRTEAGKKPAGALLFSCNGRGTRMFPMPDHDVRVLQEILGTVPVAGFFCAGELGPVGGKNFIHGHTASIALFSA